jgi:two-component system, chemotaxis family, CheB/CheR fusion protein
MLHLLSNNNYKVSESNLSLKIPSENLFPVVGIGASAGGLDTFKRLLKAIPENSGMAFILVQHLDPSHDSILADLLQRVTRIPVVEITDNIKVAPDHIYIIPSNRLLTATDGILKLTARPIKNQRSMPIDLFFTSLAEVHQSQAIGVVLSGTGTDGTLGLKAIKDHGGFTFAQEQHSASYDAMPQSAIDADVVDFILTPENIPKQLLILNETFKRNAGTDENISEQEQEGGFKKILSLLRVNKGVDFTYYKQTTIRRRILRRVALSRKENTLDYIHYLKESKSELDILYHDLLIPVTEFFRDTAFFENLGNKLIPALFKNKVGNEPIRIWVAGCSTGQEVYSILICLYEYLALGTSLSKIQVFATDISDIAIAKARNGIYKKSEVEGLSSSRLQQFFTRTDNRFQINKTIRDMCIFASHNYLKDPPFANIDLISCRNSLIYMDPFLQKKALSMFHYALNEKGFLLLGKSETAGQVPELFGALDKQNKIYFRKQVKARFSNLVSERKTEVFRTKEYGTRDFENLVSDFQKNADDILLSKFAPPGVVVNTEMDIVQFRGNTGMWLEPPPGKPSLNVLKMAREGLAFEIRSAIHKVKTTKESLTKEEIRILFMGKEHQVTIDVIPLTNTIEPYFLILFKDTSIPGGARDEQTTNGKPGNLKDRKKTNDQIQIQKLIKELAQTREDMRSVTEDQEASNEELQSANEELLSGSEELQSLNEELETSKEETQTSNEELIIVNQELYDRNEQLNLSRLYAESIVTTIREPLVILNRHLQVRTANKSFYKKFKTTEEETEGKTLFELGNNQWDNPALRKMLEKILPDKSGIVDFEISHDFPALGVRTMLLNATQILRDNVEDQSILLAFEDVTEQKKVVKDLKLFSEELEKQVSERTYSLNKANTELNYSNESLEQFAYIASHDLQEPLRKIKTFSTLLHERFYDLLPGEAQEFIRKITSSSDRMSNLIKEVLEFSKVLHGDVEFAKVDLNNILSELVNDFDLLINEKNAIIQYDQLPEIEGIPIQIKQLFYNLLSNALKFSSKGYQPVITITSKMLSPENLHEHKSLNQESVYCEISIQDNGIGFDQKFSDQIFLIFHRLHGRQEYEGTGIGLALCKKIVINHQGEIFASSKESAGALFVILLPLKHPNKIAGNGNIRTSNLPIQEKI